MTYTPHYKIVPGGSGSFLAPPGHPVLTHHLEGFESTRHRNPFFHDSLMRALEPDFDGSDSIVSRVRKMLTDAGTECPELWLRSVYAHFRNCYVPESGSRNASDVIIHNVPQIARDRAMSALRGAYAAVVGADLSDERRNSDNYRRGVTPLYGRRRGYEVTAAPDGTKVYVYALTDDGSRYGALPLLAEHAEALESSDAFTSAEIQPVQNDGDLFVPERVVAIVATPPEPMDPERHSAVACVREYFPDHQPRLDLIADPKPTNGLCEKCGNKVQYEGKLNKLAIVSTHLSGNGITQWSYKTECTEGGDHTI